MKLFSYTLSAIMRNRFSSSVVLFLLGLSIAGSAFVQHASAKSNHEVKTQSFGEHDGRPVNLYTLTNSHGLELKAMNYGAIIVSLRVPDRKGQMADIVLGHDKFEGYVPNPPFFGALVGRYANRIANGTFTLDGKKYTLPKNDGPNTLHGGPNGFDKAMWDGEPVKGKNAVAFIYTSKDGEEGFPGNLKVKVTYTLNDNNEVVIDYEATTDQPTVLNLSQHSYFNLSGEGSGDILNTEMEINASRFTPVDSTLIPTGELRPVKGTPFDFTTPTKIGARIDDKYDQLVLGKGYDHNFVLDQKNNGGKGNGLTLAARAYDAKSGRVLEVSTTQPAVQFYTGNFLDGTIAGKQGHVYQRRNAFCLETQHYPDSPNHPDFPTTTLRPDERFSAQTVFKFSTR
ncbi:MAG: aldose epimerase family protein [Candidatus Sulfotelmatobacter sp.]